MTWETNVLVPASALSALEVVRARRGYRSRNQTVVALLEDYVQEQRLRTADERLMHIATLIRYPPPPREATSEVETGVPLRLRLDRSLWASACALAFTMPGQTVRGPSDYQARRGADAVLTALASVEPLVDPIVGEHQLLTHRQALKLWQLVVEATRTRAEREITMAAEAKSEAREIAAARGKPQAANETEVELIARRLEQDVIWHGRMRYQVAAAVVADRLNGPNASTFLALLSSRDEADEDAWLDEMQWCRAIFADTDPDLRAYMGVQGRGAGTVWRATRAVRLDAMLAWIAASGRVSTPLTFTITPPGWRLRLPEAWVPTALPAAPDIVGWGDHIAIGRVLLVEHEGARFVWPTRITEDGATEPVPGFEVVTGEIGTDIRRVAEVVLISTPEEDSDAGPRLSVPIPAHVACDLGLISTDRRDQQVAVARRNTTNKTYTDFRAHSGKTWRVINHDLLFADLEQRYRSADDREQARMAYARGVGPFVRYLRSINHPVVAVASFRWGTGAQFVWPVRSLAALLAAGCAEAPVLKWLAAWRREQHRQVLYADTAERWITAARDAEEGYDEVDWDDSDAPASDMSSENAAVGGAGDDAARMLRAGWQGRRESYEAPPF